MAEVVLAHVMKTYGNLYAVNDVSLTVADGAMKKKAPKNPREQTAALSVKHLPHR